MNFTFNYLLSSWFFGVIGLGLINMYTTTTTTTPQSINIENLSKKWELHKYKYLIFSEKPSEKEKGDYIELNADMTFTSISEGAFDRGEWTLDIIEKRIHLTSESDVGVLTFIIHKLSEEELVLIIDESEDSDAKNLKIIFKN